MIPFKINVPVTIQARKSAEMLLKWCLRNINDDKLNAFSKQLLQSFNYLQQPSRTDTLTVRRRYGKDSFN